MTTVRKARKTRPHIRCGHHAPHAPHVWNGEPKLWGGECYCSGATIDPPTVKEAKPQVPAPSAPLLRVIHESGPAHQVPTAVPMVIELPAKLVPVFDVSWNDHSMIVRVNGEPIKHVDCGSHTDHARHVWAGQRKGSWLFCGGWPARGRIAEGAGLLLIPEELGREPGPAMGDLVDHVAEVIQGALVDPATCMHIDFAAFVEVHRLFTDDVPESEALTRQPDSVGVDVTASCAACGRKVRFEGPIGVEVGPGAVPCVSFDGTELRATGHLGENRTPGVRVRLVGPS